MKLWNLSSFEDVAPTVLSFVDKDSGAEVQALRKRSPKTMKTVSMGLVSTVALVAMSLTSLEMRVSGSDSELRISQIASLSNIQDERPPLALLFGVSHHLKWSAAKEKEMLARAAAAVSSSDSSQNAANLIHAVLRENLPRDQKDADELASIGIRLG
jgi:hypothetical protein